MHSPEDGLLEDAVGVGKRNRVRVVQKQLKIFAGSESQRTRSRVAVGHQRSRRTGDEGVDAEAAAKLGGQGAKQLATVETLAQPGAVGEEGGTAEAVDAGQGGEVGRTGGRRW